jgi:hypothetical protein
MLSVYLGIIGYLIFLLELESPDLGNILFRVDATGKKTLSIESLLTMMKAPFIYKEFWTNKKFLNINWILCVGTGVGIGYIFNKISF